MLIFGGTFFTIFTDLNFHRRIEVDMCKFNRFDFTIAIMDFSSSGCRYWNIYYQYAASSFANDIFASRLSGLHESILANHDNKFDSFTYKCIQLGI